MPKQREELPSSSHQIEKSKVVIKGQETLFRGPIPPAEELQRYEAIQKGFADRIITMAENERNDRTDITKSTLEKNAKLSHQGQIFAFSLCSLVIGASVAFAWLGHPWPGSILGTSGFAGIITAFIVSHRGNHKNE